MTKQTDTQKQQKAAAERLRKAKIKAAEKGEPVGVVLTDRDDTFCVALVHPDGSAPVVADLTGIDRKAADAAAKDPAALATKLAEQNSVLPEPTPSAPEAAAGEQPATEDEPREPREFSPRELFLLVFDAFAVDTNEVAAEFGIDAKKARRELKKLEKRGLVVAQDVNDAGQGERRSGQYGTVAWQSAAGTIDDTTREQAEKAYDDLAASEAETKATRRSTGSDAPRSQGRKLVAKVGDSEVIIRMSERQQAQCIAATGGLPKIGSVEFVRADGTPTDKIAASAAASDED